MNKNCVRSDIVKLLREHERFTQTRFSEKARLSQKTISNIEKGHENQQMHSINEHTIKQLEKTLKVSREVLSGKKPVPDRQEARDVPLKLTALTELNYDLVCRYYSISRQDIFDIAPLLFFLAAEQCLDMEWEAITSGQYEDDLEYREQRAIAHSERNILNGIMSLHDVSPLVSFLEKEAVKPRYKAQMKHPNWEDLSYPFPGESFLDNYLVCKDLLKEITLGSAKAEKALREGAVRLADIPENLFKAEKASERVQWIEEKARQQEAAES